MVIIPPRHYCVVNNPVLRDEENRLLTDEYGQIRLQYGDQEIRFAKKSLPIISGEELAGTVTRLKVIETNQALHLRALRDFTVNPTLFRRAGDEWLFERTGTYIPAVEVEVVAMVTAKVIKPNQALHLLARQACTDRQGNRRKAGEDWLVKEEGAYLPQIDEEIIGIVHAYVLTERKALHLKAKRTFQDVFNRQRRAGDEWLVTISDAEIHIPDVFEQVVGEVEVTTLSDRQWCIVRDPIDELGKPQLGMRQVRPGKNFLFSPSR